MQFSRQQYNYSKNVKKPHQKEPEKERNERTAAQPRSGVKTWFRDWAGVIVSACALAVSVYSGYETRLHDRVSVRPHITVSFHANEKDTDPAPGATAAGWDVVSDGAGAAIIDAFQVLMDGKPVENWDDIAPLSEAASERLRYEFGILHHGSYIQPSSNVLHLYWLKSPPTAVVGLVKNHKRLEIRITYCSFYDECWETTSRNRDLKSVRKGSSPSTFGMSPRWADEFSNPFYSPEQSPSPLK